MSKKDVKQALGYKVGAPRTPSVGVAKRIILHRIYTCFSIVLTTLCFGGSHVTTLVNGLYHAGLKPSRGNFKLSVISPAAAKVTVSVPDGRVLFSLGP